ncbi:chaperonin-like RbcX protein 2, chloroplastic isoform X1 [Telopea speciosissima]|uniref:chaperonin-like RbcX protein 2, chloroplastic isoform X1 n=1 Tax=Telopea speciosissima TaxID=54955 RepID=UPI001CC45BA4|nr:chaperonin-like RbcX protein 2, chloroplastic isoform X1 [Telopea speciosissima]XP_043692491.1 chaperonin-like RbcX protein 2, chloroplastic isoform X1 [Telopea speciosissima]
MVGAVSIVGSAVVDSHTCPCLCLDALSLSSMNFKSTSDLGLSRNLMVRKQLKRNGALELSSSFVDAWHEWRLSAKVLSGFVNGQHSRKQNKGRSLVIVDELAGQYEDSFEDVKTQILNYFTFKAVRTVLTQLYEMNPTDYRWFYDFVATNQPGDGKRFIRTLGKEKQDLAERVMVTRLHLYGKWVKKCDHAAIYQEISDQNLELMRERLIETVIWPSDDSNTEKIG